MIEIKIAGVFCRNTIGRLLGNSIGDGCLHGVIVRPYLVDGERFRFSAEAGSEDVVRQALPLPLGSRYSFPRKFSPIELPVLGLKDVRALGYNLPASAPGCAGPAGKTLFFRRRRKWSPANNTGPVILLLMLVQGVTAGIGLLFILPLL